MRRLCCLILLLSGCGGSPSSTPVVRVAINNGTFTHIPVLLAAKLGYCEQERIEDLRGATVGVFAEVTTTTIGTGATGVAAIEHGRVDAGLVSPTTLILLKRRHPNLQVLFDPQSDEFFRAYSPYALLATSAWLRQNPDTARKFTRAVLRASRAMRERPVEEIVALLPPEARSEDPTVDIEALRTWRDAFSADGVIPPDAFEAVRQVVALTVDEVRNANLNLRDLYTNELLTEAK